VGRWDRPGILPNNASGAAFRRNDYLTTCRRVLVWAVMIISAADFAFAQGYGGPSMLSRGGNRPGRRGRAPIDISAYGAIRGTFDTGLTPVQLQDDGTLASENAYGVQAEIGAYGTHSWKRSILGLDYRGDYRRTTRKSAYSGVNQAISLDLQTQLTKRWSLLLREAAGTTNRAFGGFAVPASTDLQSLNLVNSEVFDSRSYFSQTTATVGYRKSARTTLIGSADGFFVRRPDPRLVGVVGYRVNTGVDYRFNSRSSVLVSYTYLNYSYPSVHGGSIAHGLATTFTRAVTRSLSASVAVGAFRLKAFGTQSVTLSPEVAALLGQTTGFEAFTRRSWVPQVQASANYTLERSRLSLTYMTGISPGNGVYLTSQASSVAAGYSYTGLRKVSLGASTRYSRAKSRSVTIGDLETYSAGGGLNYRLASMMNLSCQADYRTFQSPGLHGREGVSLTLGLTVSPSRIPLSIW
jgi:hypothetical protein